MDFFKRIPPLVWVGAAALLAYLYFSHQQSAQASTQGVKTSGGGGSIRTGNTRIAKDAIKIDVSMADDGQGKGKQHQPGPKPPDATKEITVPRDETLGQLAKYLHWTPETLSQVEELNAVSGKELTAKSKLKKGSTIIRPVEKPQV